MYRAQFYRFDGAKRTDIGGTQWLRATSLDVAETAALALGSPVNAQFIDIHKDGQVASTLRLGNVTQLRVNDRG